MYERAILAQFRRWAERSMRKPLVLRGARQVGKTSAVRLFAREFDQYIELNCERAREGALFRRGLTAREVLQAILLERNLDPNPCRRLLFIDEIQACPEAIEALRYFHEDLPNLHVIAAGSLLEAVLERQRLEFPVGRVTFLSMHPLSFTEFLAAIGKGRAVEALEAVPLEPHAYATLLRLFHVYTMVGGMPEVVAHYAGTEDIASVGTIYQDLLTAFLDDTGKYARSAAQAAVLRHCIETAPLVAGRRITLAGFGNSTYRSREIGEALRALQRAMLLELVFPTTATRLPLVPDTRKSPRLQFLDTGLINYYAGLQPQLLSVSDLHGLYRGILAEHIVGQEIIARSTDPLHRPVFWVRESPQANAEVDFVIAHQGHVVPAEVKAGAVGTLRSLHQFVERSGCELAIRLHAGPLGIETVSTPGKKRFRLLNLPYFLASKIGEYIDWASRGPDQARKAAEHS